ncbi:MAG: bifunctional oligoribonuclease/PAP phosphatase NrnA [Clostridia bacterium]|nr:bifunctional oligoribonuclease/PAP phosphatase NrnA [Clostridia bacterium]
MTTPSECSNAAVIPHFISRYGSFAVFTHLHPDGDALGSSYALTVLLRALGKRAETVLLEPPPAKYVFPEFDELYTVLSDAALGQYEAAIAVDCAAVRRLGAAQAVFAERPDLSIDHHVSNDCFAQVNYVEDAPATSQIIFKLFSDYEIPLDTAAQIAIYMGITTDTGNLTYSSTTPEAFRICYELSEMGLNTSAVAEQIHNTRSWAATELIAEFIRSIRLHCDGRFALGFLSLDELKRLGATTADTESLVNYARDVETVQVACFLREIRPECYKVSLRSKGIDVAALAARYGGGGHRRAAGCVMQGRLDSISKELVEAAEELLV